MAFNNSLFSCFNDPMMCIVGWCVPCVGYGMIKEEYQQKAGLPPSSCFQDGLCNCLWLAFCPCVGIHQWSTLRGEVRNKYMIPGGGLGDCCSVCCCTPCAFVQLSTQLRDVPMQQQNIQGQGAVGQ
eukprot:Rmarinus@m.4560